MDDLTLILSLVNLLFLVFFGLWNIKINRENQILKAKEFYLTKNKLEMEQFDKRPRLEIVDYINNINGRTETPLICDIDCVVLPFVKSNSYINRQIFIYDVNHTNSDEWVSVYFRLRNIGLTSIDHLFLSYNDSFQTSLLSTKDNEHLEYIRNQLPNYAVIYDKEIKTNATLTMKIKYHKSSVAVSMHSAETSFWLFDSYNKTWEQPLFVHRGKINDSYQSSSIDFKKSCQI